MFQPMEALNKSVTDDIMIIIIIIIIQRKRASHLMWTVCLAENLYIEISNLIFSENKIEMSSVAPVISTLRVNAILQEMNV